MIYDVVELLSENTRKVVALEDRDDSLEAIVEQIRSTHHIYKKYGLVVALNAVLNR